MLMAYLLPLALLLAGYLLGSIPSGWLAGRWLAGVDIRQQGSGSTGATNVLRVVGKGPALALLTTALVLWRHRTNLQRLLAGTEPKLGEPKAG